MSIKLSELFKQFFDKIDELHVEEVRKAKHETYTLSQLINQAIPNRPLLLLNKVYQKAEVRYDESSETYSAVLWYDGRGMLPPNIELYRIDTEDNAIRALYAAALIAFPREPDDSK